MPLLDMQHLSVRYEQKRHQPLTAVQDVSFSIEPAALPMMVPSPLRPLLASVAPSCVCGAQRGVA